MGLSSSRRKATISRDPNNLDWSRSNNFGRRILESQGWSSGRRLGSSANANANMPLQINSYQSILPIKTAGSGLGALKSSGSLSNPGLNGFQDLLGRLNGASETDTASKQHLRQRMTQERYLERKGQVIFVNGGLLQNEDTPKPSPDRAMELSGSTPATSFLDEGPEDLQHPPNGSSVRGKGEDESSENRQSMRKKKKGKKRKMSSEKTLTPSSESKVSSHSEAPAKAPNVARRGSIHGFAASPHELGPQKSAQVPPNSAKGNQSTLVGKVLDPEKANTHRHGVRRRNIREKRRSVMDAQALNEILMVRA